MSKTVTLVRGGHGAGPESVADVRVDGCGPLADGAFVSFSNSTKSIVPKVRELARTLARAANLSELSCLAR